MAHHKTNKTESLDGTGRQICCYPDCNKKSLAGYVKDWGHCPYHHARRIWGVKWAKKCYPNYTPVRVGGQNDKRNL